MPKPPLQVLKKGLAKLRKAVQARRESLLERLRKKEKITDEDEQWLDQDANHVDEEAVVDALDHASDYERGLARLSSQQKGLVEKLKELGSGLKEAPPLRKKRKQPEPDQRVKKKPEKPAPSEKKKPDKATEGLKRENATNAQRIEILDWYHANGRHQTKTAVHWDKIYPKLRLKQPLISDWVREESKWRAQREEELEKGKGRSQKRRKQVEHPEVDEMLELWVAKAMWEGVPLSGELLRQKWTRFADLTGVPGEDRVSLSNGWLEAFKRRCGLRQFKQHGEAGSVNPADAERERQRIRDLIKKYGYRLKDIFNVDETGLCWAMPPDRGLMDKPKSGVKANKKRLTYTFTANADGSEKLEPIVIGKAERPRAFQKKSGRQLGFHYCHNGKAWMTAAIYQEWLRNWDAKLRREGRHILLLQDNFAGHKEPEEGLTNIRLESFAPNLTSHVQPNDAGIIRCFKAHYRKRFVNRAIDRYDRDVPTADIYDLDQLEAMRMADLAWGEVKPETIHNCWVRAGILPPDLLRQGSDDVDETPSMEKELGDSLTQLEECGALRGRNRMDINELLNPVVEKEERGQVTDEDICKTVQEVRAARESMEVNGGDDDDGEDQPAVIEKPPTQKEALAAASTLSHYLTDKNQPFARQLGDMLASFGRQTRLDLTQSMRTTQLTDYFTRTGI